MARRDDEFRRGVERPRFGASDGTGEKHGEPREYLTATTVMALRMSSRCSNHSGIGRHDHVLATLQGKVASGA